jgi:hypothetical protein
MAKENKAVVPTAPQAVVPAADYGADAGVGFENQTRADISIPFLTVLQALSPQITSMEAAKPGMLFNTVTDELVDGKTGRVFVPATTKHQYVEWVPREKGGGFVAAHEADSEVVKQAMAGSKDFGKYTTPNGNQLQETFYIYGMLLDEADQPAEMAVIGFTSTKIGVYRRWNTKVNMFTLPQPDGRKVRPPLFAHKVRITTVKEKNNKGEFFNFELQPANGSVAASLLPPGHAALEAAKQLRDMIVSGTAKADYASQQPEAAGTAADPNWNT